MWTLSACADYVKRRDRWPKKYRREFAAVHDNLDTLHGTLNEGVHSEQTKRQFGFLHSKYPTGILSIDQKGGGAGLKQTRLYLYPDDDEKCLYLLTMGGKDSQSEDVKFCKEWVEDHLSQKNTGTNNG
jgi:hypothetical protein